MQKRNLWRAVAMALGFLLAASSAWAHSPLRGRLVFADVEKPVVSILDLDSGEITHRFDVPKPNPRLALADGGRYVLIVTGDQDGTVRLLDTGILAESHGDHMDVEKVAPRMLDLALTGERPVHIDSRHGWAAVFYDGPRPGSGAGATKASFVEIASLRGTPLVRHWNSPGPQHGLAVPLGDRLWAVTVPNPRYAKGEPDASSLPIGVQIVDAKRERPRPVSVRERDGGHACHDLHGHAGSAGTHVFACKALSPPATIREGGLLVLTRRGSRWNARKLAYPDHRRASTIKAAGGAARMVANYGGEGGYRALLRIGPAAQKLTAADVFAIPGDQEVCRFAVTSGGRVANLLADGTLRIYVSEPDWREIARFDAVAPFDCRFGAPGPTPDLAVQESRVFVSDPVGHRIREYDAERLRQGLDFPVDGKPANLAGGAAGG